jgi:hypothetical protein
MRAPRSDFPCPHNATLRLVPAGRMWSPGQYGTWHSDSSTTQGQQSPDSAPRRHIVPGGQPGHGARSSPGVASVQPQCAQQLRCTLRRSCRASTSDSRRCQHNGCDRGLGRLAQHLGPCLAQSVYHSSHTSSLEPRIDPCGLTTYGGCLASSYGSTTWDSRRRHAGRAGVCWCGHAECGSVHCPSSSTANTCSIQ